MPERLASLVGVLASLGLAMGLGAQSAAEQLAARMTLEEKVGQLFMSWTLSREQGQQEERAELRALVEEVGLGGVILSLGSTAEATALIRELQARAEVPLLMAGDFEAGVAYRLTGATELGSNMLLGAGGDPSMARAMGRATALEARALGFHWVFAPVVDVNVNPRNPIINVRSFGEDPTRVAGFAREFVVGVESAGLLSTLKHFPGHGDVATDSHLEMPVVHGDRARLDRVELVPFVAAIDAGASAVMTGHLSVPGLGEAAGVSATLSRRILTEVLREELAFDGIVVTDALDMGGVQGDGPPGEAAVRALAAGADLLLMPPKPRETRAALVEAVRTGRVSMARLDSAVAKILGAKERMGLLGSAAPAPAPAVDLDQHVELARSIAARGVTLVRDRAGAVPLAAGASVALLTLLDEDSEAGDHLPAELRRRGVDVSWHRLHPGSGRARIAAAVTAAEAADVVVAAMHVRVRSYSGEIGLPPEFAGIAELVSGADRAIGVSFGNPYLIEQLPQVPAYICAYNDGRFTEQLVGELLAGSAAALGRLPITIPGVAEVGDGLGLYPGRQLGVAAPADEGFLDHLRPAVLALLERAVADRVFPGAVAMVVRRGNVVLHEAVGRETYGDRAPRMARSSLFDLASLTKVCATGPVVLRLVARGALSLDQPVSELLPEFDVPGAGAVTIRHLMTHSSGLPASARFFESVRGREEIVAAAASTPLASAPGERELYSDLGMILLMACAERASGVSFDALVAEEVTGPLAMTGARFAAPGSPLKAVPTELCRWRRRMLRGEVHDENAFAMGGVSGHAGLFGTAEDVAKLGAAFLGGGRGWLPAPLARAATRRAGLVDGSSRALCWDVHEPGGHGGSFLSPGAFGHTGFTGTAIWCDPRTDICLVLLTNRVHPTRDGRGIRGVRAAFADTVIGALAR